MPFRSGIKAFFAENRSFFTTMITLGLPIAFQNLISSCLNLVDTVMLGRLGEAQIASVGLANQVFFFFMIFIFGICSGTNIFISQYWGKGDFGNVKRVNGLGTLLSLSLAIPFCLACIGFPDAIMHIFSKDPEVIRLGSVFLRITALTYPLVSVNMSYSFGMRAIGNPKPPAIIGSIALVTNTVLGYSLIFGLGPIPALGVQGAASALVIARILELSLTLSYVYGRKTVLASSIKQILAFDPHFFKQYINTAGPVLANEGLWSLAILFVNIAYSKLGTQSVAAVQISNTIQNIFFVLIFGVSNASSVMVGNKVGAGEYAEARRYATLILYTSGVLGVLMGLIILASSPILILIFKVTPDTRLITQAVLRVNAVITLVRCINIVIIVGIMRGGGDTKYSLFIDVGSLWLIGLPMAYMGAVVWHLPVYTVIAMVALEEIAKVVLGLVRILSGKWVHDVTVQGAH